MTHASDFIQYIEDKVKQRFTQSKRLEIFIALLHIFEHASA